MSRHQSIIRHQRALGGFGVSIDAGRLVRLDQRAPMRVLFPDPEAGDPVLLALVNTAGGLAGGDAITQEITVGSGAATVTSASAEKVYRSLGPEARIDTRIALGSDALLEWLPQETILFEGSRLERRLSIGLASGSRLIAAEMLVFGRAARGEVFRHGRLADRWHVACEERPLWIDSLVLDGDLAARFASPFALAGAEAMATLLVTCADPPGLVARLRDDDPEVAATVPRPGLALARWLGAATLVRAALGAAIRRTRNQAFGLAPRLPRLWMC